MRLLSVFAALVMAVGLAACTFNATFPQPNEALNAEAEAMFSDMVTARDDAVIARMSAENDMNQVKAQLPMLRQMIGEVDGALPVPRTMNVQSITSNQGKFYVVEQAYVLPDRVAHVQTSFVKQGETWKVRGFHINVDMLAMPEAAEAEIPVLTPS